MAGGERGRRAAAGLLVAVPRRARGGLRAPLRVHGDARPPGHGRSPPELQDSPRAVVRVAELPLRGGVDQQRQDGQGARPVRGRGGLVRGAPAVAPARRDRQGTARAPAARGADAEGSPLARDVRVLKQRRLWYRMYQEKKLSLEGLREVAPLIAAAEEKRMAAHDKRGGATPDLPSRASRPTERGSLAPSFLPRRRAGAR